MTLSIVREFPVVGGYNSHNFVASFTIIGKRHLKDVAASPFNKSAAAASDSTLTLPSPWSRQIGARQPTKTPERSWTLSSRFVVATGSAAACSTGGIPPMVPPSPRRQLLHGVCASYSDCRSPLMLLLANSHTPIPDRRMSSDDDSLVHLCARLGTVTETCFRVKDIPSPHYQVARGCQ